MPRMRSDPWTGDQRPFSTVHRLLTVALICGVLVTGILLGRWSTSSRYESTPPIQAAGSSRTESGVPVAYPRTAPGAVAAATNYTALLAGPLILDPGRYRAAESVITAPSARVRVTAEGEQAIVAVNDSTQAFAKAAHGVHVVVRYTPLAYRLNAYEADRASVSVWGLWLVGEQGFLRPTETWSTRTVALEWLAGDWKLADSSSSPGPTPQPGQQAAQTSELPPQLTDFQEYAHVAR